MAQNDINIGLNVSSNGSLNRESEEAKKLAAALKSAQQAASGTSKALSSAKRASASPAKTKAPSIEENIDYGRTRGSVGTGAASRDFAKQSQGLGGLVRLYATFAANIFALTAAFTALSNAADTTNLVKGLDQLGAASGRALGTLAKKLADTSEGAISIRDSLESVSKAATAGLSDKQILQLGESAKKAAQALGLSMSDALSRLSRGVTKLEPELLDELGIFIRIDDATRKYGLTVGKSAAQLSDFEKRQAFANAVLDQAKEKFGAIELDVNPYSKLLASFQNISFAGLELVNKVLGPLVKLLSESPTAFSTLLTVIGAKLISTALPAIGEWRNGLKSAAEQAAKTADAISKSFGDEFQGRLEANFRLPQLQKSLDNARKKVAEISKTIPTSLPVPSSIATAGFANASRDEKGFNAVNRAIESRQEKLRKNDSLEKTMSATRVAETQKEIEYLKNQQTIILRTIELRKAENVVKNASLNYEQAADKALNAADKKQSRFDTEVIALKQAEKARLNYDKISAVSNAVETTRVLGVKLAWQGLNNEIADKGITGLDKFTTLAKGGLASVGTRILGIIGSFANLLPVATAAFAIYEIAASVFSKNSKEVDAFNSSVEDTNKAVETINSTVSLISNKDIFSQSSISSVIALSNAIRGLSDSTTKLVADLDRVNTKSGTFDRFIDGFLSVIGKDVRSKFTREFVPALLDSFNNLPEGELKDAYQKKLESVLGVSAVTVQETTDSLNKLSPEKLIEVTKALSTLQKESSDKFKASADAAQGFRESLNSSVKAYQELSLSLTASDPLSKLGASLISSGTGIQSVLKDTRTNIAGLVELLNDNAKLSLLPENSRNLLLSYSDSIKTTQGNIINYSKSLREAQNRLESLKKVQKDSTVIAGATGDKVIRQNTTEDQNKVIKEIEGYQKSIKEAQAEQLKIVDKFANVGTEVFKKGIELLVIQVSAAREQASLSIFKAQNQQATGFAKVAVDAAVQKQEIDIQLKLINVQEQLVVAQTKSNILLTQLTLSTERARLQSSRSAGQGGPVDDKIAQITAELSDVDSALDILKTGISKIDFKRLTTGVAGLLGTLVAQTASTNAQKAKLSGDSAVVDINAKTQNEELSFKVDQDKLKAGAALNTQAKERLALLLSLSGNENLVLLALKQQAEVLADQNNNEVNRLELVKGIADAAKTVAINSDEKIKAASQKQFDLLVSQLAVYDEQVSAKNKLRDISLELEKIDTRANVASKELAFNVELAQLKRDTAIAELESSKEYLDYLIQIKAVNEADGINRNAALEKQLLLQKQISEESAVKAAAANDRASLSQSTDKQLAAAGSQEAANAIADVAAKNLERINLLEDERIRKIRQQTEAKIELNAQIATEQAQYAKITSISDIIAKAFEGMGESASKFGAGIGNVLKTIATTNNKRVAMEKDTSNKLSKIDLSTAQGREKYIEEKQKADKESLNFELDAAEQSAGAAKGMFSEKTFAFRAFAAVEKAIHIAKLAMLAVEVGAQIASVGPVVAAEGAKAAAGGVTAIINALKSLPPPFSFIAGAAMAAVVASVLGGSPKKVEVPGGISAKDRQETQGTGMAWVAGKKVETGGGTFGDAEAKSQSIKNSLEIIKDTAVEGLTYTSKTVNLLEKINEGIGGTSKAIYNIAGIRTGSGFGTKEETKSSGISGLFGKTVTKNIQDSGIQIIGSFNDIANNLRNSIKAYETVATTTKKSGFLGLGGSVKMAITTSLREVDSVVADQLSEVFQNATDLFIDVGSKLGIAEVEIANKLGKVNIDQLVSLRGLKGKELEDELSSVIGSILDTASAGVFESLKKYRKFGEGMLETATRVIDSNVKVNDALRSIGKAAVNTADNISIASLDITEALVQSADDLSDFIDKISNYKDNFLTASEALAPVQTALVKELENLGFSSINTREEFKNLVESLDLTTKYGTDTFKSLINIQESFSKVYASTADINSVLIEYLEVQEKSADALAASRAQELDGLTDVQRAIKIRIYALEDEISLQDKIKEARDAERSALEDSIKSLKGYIATLKDFKNQLLGGESSILTPEQKYVQARSVAESTAAAARGPTSTAAELESRNAALEKLPSVLQSFLSTSKISFASSAQYVTDFNSVMDILDATGSSLEAQKTDQEKQLEQLLQSTAFLQSIDTGVKSLAELALDTKTLLSKYTGESKGAPSASAIAAVESSLVAVDNLLASMRASFEATRPDKTTGPVVVNNDALTAEVQGLRREIQGLRADNQAQSEKLINTNAVVTNQAAELQAAAVREAAERDAYLVRTQPIYDFGGGA